MIFGLFSYLGVNLVSVAVLYLSMKGIKDRRDEMKNSRLDYYETYTNYIETRFGNKWNPNQK